MAVDALRRPTSAGAQAFAFLCIRNDDLTEALPADDLGRILAVAAIQDRSRTDSTVAASPYTVLVGGAQTNGRYCLLELVIPPGGGPPLHRHDFEELFILLAGEIEFTVRGEPHVVGAPHALNVPANAPHRFFNRSGKPAHLLCMCTPAGLEDFFETLNKAMEADRATSLSTDPTAADRRKSLTRELAQRYRMELLES